MRSELLLRDVLLRCVDLFEHDTAVVFGEERVSWSEQAIRCFRTANQLHAEGVTRGDRVAVLQPNGTELVDIAFAAALLGAVLVPMSSRLVPDEVAHVLNDARPRIAFIDPTHPGAVVATKARVLPTRTAAFVEFRDAGSPDEPPSFEMADDAVLQLYTSGTTGRPKGAVHTQRTMIQNGLTVLLSQGLDHSDSFLATTPLTHAASGTRIFSLALDGLKLVIMSSFTVDGFFDLVARERITTTILVPTMLADVVDSPALATADLSSMRFIVYGAAPTPVELIERAIERLPCGLFQGYGLTEGSPALTALTSDEHRRFAADPTLRHRLRSLGRAVPGARIRIVDEHGARLPPGEPGEMQVRSTKTMTGYWGAPELTDSAFVDGWLATGDVAKADDAGYLYLVDRKKDMLISGGFNVYPSEIEHVIREHHAVGEVAVVGVANERWGEVPVAFLELTEAGSAGSVEAVIGEIKVACRDRLSDYKQPRQFHVVDAIPRTDSGKIHKPTLRQMASQGEPFGTVTQ